MHLELKGEEKFAFDDQHDKMNRNFWKEYGHGNGGGGGDHRKKRKLITNFEEVRNMIVPCSMQYWNQKPGHCTKWKRSCIRTEKLLKAQL